MHSALVQLFADLVVDEVNVSQTVVGKHQNGGQDIVALANLSKTKPEIWKEILKDAQQATMKLRLEEKRS